MGKTLVLYSQPAAGVSAPLGLRKRSGGVRLTHGVMLVIPSPTSVCQTWAHGSVSRLPQADSETSGQHRNEPISEQNVVSKWLAVVAVHLSMCCEIMPKRGRRDLPPYTSRARCPSCGERYHSRAPRGEYHRYICPECRAGRSSVRRGRPIERRADCPATLRSRRPAAGHRECANYRFGAFIETMIHHGRWPALFPPGALPS
jgi:hypothetical protein